MAYLLDANVFIQAKNFEMLRHERARFVLGPRP
jgi:hypothetical protein